jgi:peptidoglycan biosynthesis protein MviN/MurJ (putative lipid II flippase)
MTSRIDLRPAIGKSSAVVAVLATISPAAGLLLEIIIAWRYGASSAVDAYRATYLLINFGNLFATFLLPHLIIPAVAHSRELGRESEGWRATLTTGYVLASLGLALLVYTLMAPQVVFDLLAPGLNAIPPAGAAMLLGACTFALVAALCCGVIAGLLQLHQSFAVPSLSQTLFNVSMCLVIAIAGSPQRYAPIAIGIMAGSILMLTLHCIALIHLATRLQIPLRVAMRPTLDGKTMRLLANGYPLLAILITALLSNFLVYRQLSLMGSGTLAQFGYALKLVIITTVAPTALATVIFPSLARAHAQLDSSKLNQLTGRALNMTLLLSAPLAILLFVFRGPTIDLLFNRGSMQASAIEAIKIDFAILLIQAVPGNLNTLLQKLSFALHDTRISALFSCLTLFLLAAFLGPASSKYGKDGVLYVYSAVQTAVPICFLFYQILRFRVSSFRALARAALLVGVLCGGIALTCLLVRYCFATLDAGGKIQLAAELIAGFAASLVVGSVLSKALKIAEITDLEILAMSWLRRVSI